MKEQEGPSTIDEPKRTSRKTLKVAAVSAIIVALVISAIIASIAIGRSSTNVTTPKSDLSLVHADQFNTVPPYSIMLKFGGFSRYVNWSDMKILLSDGDHSVSWLPPTIGLSGGSTVSYLCGHESLGSLSVLCNITDIIGNGQPNSGDTITLTTNADATFLASHVYDARVIYIPDGGLICSLSFNGTD